MLVATIISIVCGGAQERPNNAHRLIWELSHSTPHKVYGSLLPYYDDRGTAKAISDLGSAAVPEIERALASVEAEGANSAYYKNSGWLLLAYARTLGPLAGTRLRSMTRLAKFSDLSQSLDQAMALSLNLTSYVSGFDELSRPAKQKVYDGVDVDGPRWSLDPILRHWERGHLFDLSAYGPLARSAMLALLSRRSRNDIKSQLWPGNAGIEASIGYRFRDVGMWAEPSETLADKSEYWPPLADEYDIVTDFTDGYGKPCGSHRIKFLTKRATGSSNDDPYAARAYMLNEPDMEGLIGVVGACVSQGMP
jgi:hypothetical protein